MFTSKRRSTKAVLVATAFLLGGFIVPSLSLASTGSFQISQALTQDFDTQRFDAGYRYYALMDAGSPYAIVGLGKGYRISGPYWKPVNPGSPIFTSLVNQVQESPIVGSSPYGAYILDSQNRIIGTLYSSYMAGEMVDNRTKTVSITLHPNWLLN